MFTCNFCHYITNKSFNMRRHIARNHDVRLNEKSYDVRLKENFKLFVSGPSRCGKTVFVSKLLESIHAFAQVPPTNVIYVYKVWQPKYDEFMSLGVNFMEDNDNIVNNKLSLAKMCSK